MELETIDINGTLTVKQFIDLLQNVNPSYNILVNDGDGWMIEQIQYFAVNDKDHTCCLV